MAGSINEFLSKTRGGFATSNLFQVSIIPPQSLSLNTIFEDVRNINFLCNTASIPGLTMATTEKALDYRERIKQKLYDDINLTFYCTESLKEIKFFNDWLNLAVNPFNNRTGYHSDYTSTIIIAKLSKEAIKENIMSSFNENEMIDDLATRADRAGSGGNAIGQTEGWNKKSFSITLFEAFPKRIEPLELSYATSDIVSVNVSFTYRYHNIGF